MSSMFDLTGKTALCTGGTRGLGAAMTLSLAKAGAAIVMVQRNMDNLETYNAILAIPQKCTIVLCDLADVQAVKGLTQKVTGKKSEGGLEFEIDILFNCGGINKRAPSELYTDDDWNEVIQVNLSSVWTLSRDIGRHMLSSRGGVTGEEVPTVTHNRGNGKIIAVSSVLSFQGGATVPAYSTSKHGLLGMTKALSNEWSARGVNVNTIAPGYIATDMNAPLLANEVRNRQVLERIPAGRWGKPTDFDGVVVFLASNASDYVCGATIVVDGGWMGR